MATVDYAVQALEALGIQAAPPKVLHYIMAADEWRPKIAKLGLTEAKVAKAVKELGKLFPRVQLPSEQ